MEHLLEWGEAEDKDRLRRTVMEWGYPRWIDDDEMVVSAWFTYGPGIFWLHVEDGYEDELLVHCCEPESDRGRPLARDWLAVVKTIAQLWGFEWIRFGLTPTRWKAPSRSTSFGSALRPTTAAYVAPLGGLTMAKAPKVPKQAYRPADDQEADEARERERQRLKRRQGAASTLLTDQKEYAATTGGGGTGAQMLGGGGGSRSYA